MSCKECFYYRAFEHKPHKGGCWVSPPAVFPFVAQSLEGAQMNVVSMRPAEVGEDDPICREFKPARMAS